MAAEECLPTKIKKYKKWYLRFDENIGEKSRYGKVYNVCKKDDCSYVMKVIKPTNKYGLSINKIEAKKSFKKEVEMQNKCATSNSEERLCLKVEDSWSCGNGEVNVIVTRLLKETVLQYLGNINIEDGQKSAILKEIIRKIFLLHFNAGIHHGDTHLNNFMIDHDNSIKIIDLGLSQEIGLDENGVVLTLRGMYEQILTDYKILLSSIDIRFNDTFPKLNILKGIISRLSYSFSQIYDILGKYKIKSSKLKLPNLSSDCCKTEESFLSFYEETLEKARIKNYVDINSIRFLLLGVEKLTIEKYLRKF
jgi:serine/threonine protein kinase